MKNITLILPLLLSVSLIYLLCCTPTLVSTSPFYKSKDVVFDPALLGEWVTEDPSEVLARWEFTESGEDHYLLRYEDVASNNASSGLPHLFTAHLFTLGEQTYLDILPVFEDDSSESSPEVGLPPQSSMMEYHTIVGHTLWKVQQFDQALQLSLLNYEKLERYAELHPGAVQFGKSGNDGESDSLEGYVTTMPTKDLQRLVLEYREWEGAFSDEPEDLIRPANSVHLGQAATPPVPESAGQ